MINKKGSIVDLIPMVIILFVFFIAIFIAGLVWYEINLDDGLREGPTQTSIMNKNNIFFTQGLDGLFVFFYFGMNLVVIISAALLRTNPMLLVPIIIVWLIISGTIGLIAKMTYDDIVADESFSNILPNFPKTQFIMNQIHIISLVVGFLIIISFMVSSRYTIV